MMNEFDIFQNKILASYVLWEFCKNYSLQKKQPPSLKLIMVVLPICFNKRIVDGIKSRNFREGSLYRALDENRDLFIGLEDRIESMGKLTFETIYLCSVSGILDFDRDRQELRFVPKAIKESEFSKLRQYPDLADIFNAAKRIGTWFGKMNSVEITSYLKLDGI